MHDILAYFDTVPTYVRTIILISGISFFLILEAGIPLFKFDYKKGKHAAINITFTLITLVINLFGAGIILTAINFNQSLICANKSWALALISMWFPLIYVRAYGPGTGSPAFLKSFSF